MAHHLDNPFDIIGTDHAGGVAAKHRVGSTTGLKAEQGDKPWRTAPASRWILFTASALLQCKTAEMRNALAAVWFDTHQKNWHAAADGWHMASGSERHLAAPKARLTQVDDEYRNGPKREGVRGARQDTNRLTTYGTLRPSKRPNKGKETSWETSGGDH
jgi:hypothetical protein